MHINEKNRTPKLAEPDEGPSKSELKRQMTERQKLAEVLAALSSDALKTIPLDEAIKTAIAETNKIKSFDDFYKTQRGSRCKECLLEVTRNYKRKKRLDPEQRKKEGILQKERRVRYGKILLYMILKIEK